MSPFRISRAAAVASGVTLVVGLLLLAAGWWLRPIRIAERALADGDHERAVEQFGVARRRFDGTMFAKRLFPSMSALVTSNEMSLLYSLRRYERILEVTAGSDAVPGSVSFWVGCALFDRALVQADSDAKLSLMSDAQQAFRRALEAAADDWDARFNYEMTGRLLSILRDQPKTSTEDIIKLLRERGPQPRDGRRTG